MRMLTIRYRYSGPEADWRETIDRFIAAVDSDDELAGRFSYEVAIGDDGVERVHWARWSEEMTVKTLQSRDYFKAFSSRLRELAGGTLETFGANAVTMTRSAHPQKPA
ncbi:MAG TPA: hypothetical protein PKE65_08020 [Rhizobiaceae bacterium]|nr:hypothetical protein [Rhizobiaceae bacterium]